MLQKEADTRKRAGPDPTVTAIAKETELVRIALFWLSQHPEFTPFASILGKYAAVRTMNACLGPTMCQRCEHCLDFLGVHLHDAGLRQLCDYSMHLAYNQALVHPVQSLMLARKSIQVLTDAVHTLATLPQQFQVQHSQLAKVLWEQNAKGNEHLSMLCSVDALKKGMDIYNLGGKQWGTWLHVGLPPILDKLQTSAIKTEKELAQYIGQEYDRWRIFGQQQLSSIPSA